jgi:hypothetical protein
MNKKIGYPPSSTAPLRVFTSLPPQEPGGVPDVTFMLGNLKRDHVRLFLLDRQSLPQDSTTRSAIRGALEQLTPNQLIQQSQFVTDGPHCINIRLGIPEQNGEGRTVKVRACEPQ